MQTLDAPLDDDIDPFAELDRQPGTRKPRTLAKRIRHLLVVTHRWSSLVLTLWVVVISITGAWLVFGARFDGWLNPGRYDTTPGDVGPTAVLDAVNDAVPEGASADYLVFPTNGNGVYLVNATDPGPTDAEDDDTYFQYFVDPGSGEINDRKDFYGGFSAWMYRGHESLWQDQGVLGVFDPDDGWCRKDADGHEPGGPKGVVCDVIPDGLDLIGWFAVALLFVIVSGFYLWYWPNVRRWATALLIKRGRGRFQFHLSLHKVVGIVVGVPLLVITFTGAAFMFPNMASWWANLTPAQRGFELWAIPEDVVSSSPPDGRDALTADGLRDVVAERFPDRTLISLNGTPADETATWQTWLDRGHSNWTREGSAGNSLVAFDQYSGEVLYDATTEDGNVFDQSWHDLQFPLHAGDFAGTPSRVAWFVVGLSPIALAVTGVVMWWVRRKRVKGIAARKATASMG